jgi:hypothetical protein
MTNLSDARMFNVLFLTPKDSATIRITSNWGQGNILFRCRAAWVSEKQIVCIHSLTVTVNCNCPARLPCDSGSTIWPHRGFWFYQQSIPITRYQTAISEQYRGRLKVEEMACKKNTIEVGNKWWFGRCSLKEGHVWRNKGLAYRVYHGSIVCQNCGNTLL